MRYILLIVVSVFISACASYDYPSQVNLGQKIIAFEGKSLAGKSYVIPNDLDKTPTLLIFGYVHKAQFDIDRWLIGLDMRNVSLPIIEVPAIKNPFARMFSGNIDDAMREGIPSELWTSVVTVYKDGDKVQKYTGNQSPKNARVILLNENQEVIYFYDRGFSVAALNDLLMVIP